MKSTNQENASTSSSRTNGDEVETARGIGFGRRILASIDRLARKLPFVPNVSRPAIDSDPVILPRDWNEADLGTPAKPGQPNAAEWLRLHHESRRKQCPIESLPDTFGGLTGYEDDR